MRYRVGLHRYARKDPDDLAVAKQLKRIARVGIGASSIPNQRVLKAAVARTVTEHRATAYEFDALPFVEKYVAPPKMVSLDLFIGEGHRLDVGKVYVAIEYVGDAQIGNQAPFG
jgi:hypothetical protein